MILIKSQNDIRNLKEAGKVSKEILDYALRLCIPGITTIEINESVERKMKENCVEPWFKEVNNYPYATCISVNEIWLHGMPSAKKLSMGDIVSVDLGVKKGKYYIDNCWTVVVDKQNATSSEIRSNTLHSNKEVTRFLIVIIQNKIESLIKVIHSKGV